VSRVAARPKVLEYEAAIDARGQVSAEGCPPFSLPEEWEAEHLLLAALLRCSLMSLRNHAKRHDMQSRGGGRAAGRITKRESDGRYAFVAIELVLDAEVEPEPAHGELRRLLEDAERDCFISASLAVAPSYVWRVNGVPVPTNRR